MMNDKQKATIYELRQQGLVYRRIAARLGISANTVKGFIYRKGITSQAAAKTKSEGCCPQCGADISLVKERKSRKFCSDACRHAWWKAHEHIIDRRAWYSCVCAGCGKAFKSYGNNKRKYCDHACYISDRYKKEVVAQ